MSEIYARRLSRVQREYDASRDAVGYVIRNWDKQTISQVIPGTGLEDLRRAAGNLDAIFLIRMFSLFEGILKEHLAQHHPGITVPEEARAVWLIDRAAQRQTPPIGQPLRNRVHEVRRYRNYLTHPSGRVPVETLFSTAIFRSSKFVDHLPEPR